MSKNGDYDELEALARRGRWLAISTVAKSGAGHVGGPFSAMDLLIALYFRVMKVDPQNPRWPQRDRFILSKGHSSIGLYTVMALRGFLPIEELKTFDKGNSRLQGHPDVTKLPGLDTSTGSLGQGLSVGLGMALGARLRGEKFHTFVIIGDGELQEGMIWEALHIAPRYKLGNLTAILDWNGQSKPKRCRTGCRSGQLHQSGQVRQSAPGPVFADGYRRAKLRGRGGGSSLGWLCALALEFRRLLYPPRR